MPLSFWVAVLHVGPHTAEKINGKHGLRVRDVRDALVCQPGLRARRDTDPERGVRMVLDVDVDGEPALVVLRAHQYLVDEYFLVSAYRL